MKLVSFHLIVLAVFLVAPEASRLVDVFLWNRATGASRQPQLLGTRRANRIALAAQLAFGIYLLGMYAYINVRFWEVGGRGRPRSVLYGIWDVEQLSVDGQLRPAHLNDYDRRWRRVILDAPDSVVFQRTDDSFGYRWMVLSDPDFEDLVVGVNVVSQALQDGGYGERILCAVFAFRDAQKRKVYWIYNYKRGAYYPFVPAGGEQRRDTERELRLKAQIGNELPIEAELERWFPLWGIPI